MNHIIQNLIAIVTGFLTNLTTTDKSNLVAAINEVNAKPSGGLPYDLISIATGWSDGSGYTFNVDINTTGVPLTITNPSPGVILIVADDPIFGKTNCDSIVKVLPPLSTGADGIAKFTLESAGTINYLVGKPDALGSDDSTQYKITMGNPSSGLSDGLLPYYYHIDIRIYHGAS